MHSSLTTTDSLPSTSFSVTPSGSSILAPASRLLSTLAGLVQSHSIHSISLVTRMKLVGLRSEPVPESTQQGRIVWMDMIIKVVLMTTCVKSLSTVTITQVVSIRAFLPNTIFISFCLLKCLFLDSTWSECDRGCW